MPADGNDPNPPPISLEYCNPNIAREAPKRKNNSVIGVVVRCAGIGVVLLLVASIVLPAFNKAHSRPPTRGMLNLKNIGLACEAYSNTHGGHFPASFEDLILNTDLTPYYLVDPDTTDTPSPGSTRAQWAANLSKGGHCSYIYAGKGLTDNALDPTDTAVAYDRVMKPEGTYQGVKIGGMEILYADGHVQWQRGYTIASTLAAATTQPTYPPPTNPATSP